MVGVLWQLVEEALVEYLAVRVVAEALEGVEEVVARLDGAARPTVGLAQQELVQEAGDVGAQPGGLDRAVFICPGRNPPFFDR